MGSAATRKTPGGRVEVAILGRRFAGQSDVGSITQSAEFTPPRRRCPCHSSS